MPLTTICVTFLNKNNELDCVTIQVDLCKPVGRHMANATLDVVMQHVPENNRILNLIVGRN